MLICTTSVTTTLVLNNKYNIHERYGPDHLTIYWNMACRELKQKEVT